MNKLILALAVLSYTGSAYGASHAAAKSGDLTPLEKKVLGDFDKAISEVSSSLAKTQECFDAEKSQQKALAAKKAQLAQEYNGKIPLALSDYLWKRAQRMDRQRQACLQSHSQLGMKFTEVDGMFGNYEPKTLDVSRPRAKFDALKVKFRAMMPPPGKRGKTAQKAEEPTE